MVLQLLLSIVAALLGIPVTVLFIQVLSALLLRPASRCVDGHRPRIAVLVPAHNEAQGIAHTVDSIRTQLTAHDRLVVVADNCSDDTAGVARDHGADVIERQDPSNRGKGYALDFGVRHLAQNHPDVVIVIDADCTVAEGTIETIAICSHATQRPVQALDMMHAPASAGFRVRIGAFAWIVKNHVRPLGMLCLGLPCHLMGTGMAIPFSLIAEASLATGHIVEDLKLGIDFAHKGKPALFCPQALVTSIFPETKQGVRDQRTRWEHGHLSVILHETPELLVQAFRKRDMDIFALAIDLAVPPLAFLTILVLISGALNFLCTILGFGSTGSVIATITLFELLLAVFFAWLKYGRTVVSLWDLILAPLYALQKIPIYIKFLLKRQVEWVRSKRNVP